MVLRFTANVYERNVKSKKALHSVRLNNIRPKLCYLGLKRGVTVQESLYLFA